MYVGSAEDVSATILLSRKHFVSFVVSGGKHSSGGASSTEGGLVIDLAKMRKVVVDPATKTVRVQGGCIWKDVDEAAAEYGLAMVGGTVNHTGVGGLTLGGGYGWLSGRYGLTIDSLLEVQMVLADGSIRTVSKDQNPDLFWAIRGAGRCFGVVVEFKFQTYEQTNLVWAGQLVFPMAKVDGIVDFANNLVATSNGDSPLNVGITAPPFMGGSPAVITSVFHNGPKSEAERVFQPLLDMEPVMNSKQERPYREINGMMNHAVEYGGRKLSKGASFLTPLRADFIRSVIPDLERLHLTVPGSKNSILVFEFLKPDVWCQVPQDATAFAHRSTHQNLLIGPFWANAEDDQKCRLWAHQIAKKAHVKLDHAKRACGKEEEPISEHGNYDSLTANARDIFGSNFDRLCDLKAKYDPDNIFDKSYSLRR